MNVLRVVWRRLVIWMTGRPPWRRVLRTPLNRTPGAQRSGELFLEAKIDLWVETREGELAKVRVLVDTGACVSLFGVEEAERAKLPVPSPESAIEQNMGTATGDSVPMRLRPVMFRVRFVEDLSAPALNWAVRLQEGRPLNKVSLLGLGGGVIENCRWVFDGTPHPDAPYGYLTIDVRQ